MLSIGRRVKNFAHTCTQFLSSVKKLWLASKGLFVEPFYAVRRKYACNPASWTCRDTQLNKTLIPTYLTSLITTYLEAHPEVIELCHRAWQHVTGTEATIDLGQLLPQGRSSKKNSTSSPNASQCTPIEHW